jgi:SpoIIAA-like
MGNIMIERLAAPDHVLALRVAGKLTAEDVGIAKSALDPMLKQHDRIGFMVDLVDFSDATAEAIAEDLRYEFSLLGKTRQFARCALVTDKEWLGAVTGFWAKLLPDLEMRTFGAGQRDQAVQWAADLPAKATRPAAFRVLPTDRDDVFAFEIDGVVSAAEVPSIIDQVNAVLGRHDRLRMLARIKHLGGVDPAAFMQSELVAMKLAALQKLERYAIIGAPGWMSKAVEIMNPMFPDIDMRTFPADREADAWTWLGARPKQ